MADDRSRDWLRQAENDLAFCAVSVREGFYSQACFIAQQAAEKAIKALAFHRSVDRVKTHSIAIIAKELEVDGEVTAAANLLDQYYISARYPDALPGGAPFDVFSREQAEAALKQARLLFKKVQDLMEGAA